MHGQAIATRKTPAAKLAPNHVGLKRLPRSFVRGFHTIATIHPNPHRLVLRALAGRQQLLLSPPLLQTLRLVNTQRLRAKLPTTNVAHAQTWRTGSRMRAHFCRRIMKVAFIC